MATFTRRRFTESTPVLDSADFSGARNFKLVNNATTTAYFNIEGINNKDVFNTASLSSLVNCSFISESIHAGFIIAPSGNKDGFANMSGSIDNSVNGLKDSLTGTFSGLSGSYTGVSASNVNITASLQLIESTSLLEVAVTNQGQSFTTGDTIIFPSQSFGATTPNGEDMTFTLKSSDISSNGTASFVFTPSATIAKEDVKFLASNALVFNINDTTLSGSAFGVDLNTDA